MKKQRQSYDLDYKRRIVQEYLAGKVTAGEKVHNADLFHSLLEVDVPTERWRRLYNERRPHSRLGYQQPITAYLPAQQAIG